MKLSDLVQSRNYFKKINTASVIESLATLQKEIDVASISLNSDLLEQLTETNNELELVKSKFNLAIEKINSIQENLDADVDSMAEPYCIANNTVDGVKNVVDLTVEGTRDLRQPMFSDEINYDILSVIRRNTVPKYPTLELFCKDGVWTKYLVAADPLYIVDIHPEFLKSTAGQFHEDYQRRLRQYLLGHHGMPPDDLSKLPQNQFGFTLAINAFDFMTLDRVHNYITQIYNLLRPGGTAFFTYNNCEESNNVRLVEKGFKGWATKTELENFCKNSGFEILNSISKVETSWLEIKKPGTLKTVKIHQSLGRIVNNNN